MRNISIICTNFLSLKPVYNSKNPLCIKMMVIVFHFVQSITRRSDDL